MREPNDSLRDRLPDGIFYLRASVVNMLLGHLGLAVTVLAVADEITATKIGTATAILLGGVVVHGLALLVRPGRSTAWALPHFVVAFLSCWGTVPAVVAAFTIVNEQTKRWLDGLPPDRPPSSSRWIGGVILAGFSLSILACGFGSVFLAEKNRPGKMVVEEGEPRLVIKRSERLVEAAPVDRPYDTWGTTVDGEFWALSQHRGETVITTELSETCQWYCPDTLENVTKARKEIDAVHVVIHDSCPPIPEREAFFSEFRQAAPDAIFVCQDFQGGPQWEWVPTTRLFDASGHLRWLVDGEVPRVSDIVAVATAAKTTLPDESYAPPDVAWLGDWCIDWADRVLGFHMDAKPAADVAAHLRWVEMVGHRFALGSGGGITVTKADGELLELDQTSWSAPKSLIVVNEGLDHFPPAIQVLRMEDGAVQILAMVEGVPTYLALAKVGSGKCFAASSNVEPWAWEEVATAPEPWAKGPPETWPQIVLSNDFQTTGDLEMFGASSFLVAENGELAIATSRFLIGAGGEFDPPLSPEDFDNVLESWSAFPRGEWENAVIGTERITTYEGGHYHDALAIRVPSPPAELPAVPLRLREDPAAARPGEAVVLLACQYSEPDCRQRAWRGRVTSSHRTEFTMVLDRVVEPRGMVGAPVVDANGRLLGVLMDFYGGESSRVFVVTPARYLGL